MAEVEAPPPKIDVQDPLPEQNWFWRRIFIFSVCTVTAIGIWIMVQTMVNLAGGNPTLIVGAFTKIIMWLLLNSWFAMTYYMVAPSAEHVTRMWQAATMFKQGVVSTTTQVAEGADGSRATAQTVTGVAPIKPVAVPVVEPASSSTGSPDNNHGDLPWKKNG